MKRFLPGCRSNVKMSPGVEGARLTQPPLRSAVKVLTAKDSPEIIRDMPPNSPRPPMPVFISTPCCAIIAPASALMDSPGSSSTLSIAKLGVNSMSVLIGYAPLCDMLECNSQFGFGVLL